jgi:ESS family glutamate:Na+ symporter
MTPLQESLVVLGLVLIVARFIKRGSTLLQKFFIPSSLVAGLIGLLLGPQVLETIPTQVTQEWATFPKLLINIVFAGLFLGKVIPDRKKIWRLAGPMIAFGNTLAWGQYVIGAALTMFVLVPVFNASPLAASLIEISFEGGHGTAAGLAPTFEQLGWSEGTDIALTIATFSIVCAILIGVLLVNWHTRHERNHKVKQAELARRQKQMIRSGYNLLRLGEKISTNPKAIIINLIAFAASIGIGWLLWRGFIIAEDAALQSITGIRFFKYLPMFPLAMIGGLILQMILRKLGYQTLIQRRTAEIISAIALDVLIASAVATISLGVLGDKLPIIVILSLAGVAWIVFGFFVLAPLMFKTYWFEKGLTNMGQSMGMTATGLLLQRLSDPSNKSKAKESFAYKQLVFEPFMGGGIVTASAVIFIHEFGLLPVLIMSSVITAFWLGLGIYLGARHKYPVQTK